MSAHVIASRSIGDCSVEVVLGDLTAEVVDAIVNAANSRLAHGGGVAGAIVRRGGRAIQEESDRIAPVPVGGAAVTGSGSLRCRHVIHAVGPIWGEGDEERKLEAAVESAFDRADALGLVSVALPAISTGIFGFPKAAGCAVIVATVCRHVGDGGSSVRLVRLVSIDRETADSFAAALTTFAER